LKHEDWSVSILVCVSVRFDAQTPFGFNDV
jgi:hypothetical protein